MITVKQLAEELQLSKVSINNRIDKLGLKDTLVRTGNRNLIPDETADAIRESFKANRKTEPPQEDLTVKVLTEQLQAKDEQIASLLRQLELLQNQNTDLLKSVREHSYLLLQANGIDADGTKEHATAIDPDTNEPEPAQEPPKKKSIFSRIFG